MLENEKLAKLFIWIISNFDMVFKKLNFKFNRNLFYNLNYMVDYIPIVISFDRNYSDYAAATVQTVFYNTKNKIKFYWIIPKIDFLLVNKLKKKLFLNNLIKIITVEKNDFNILNNLEINGHWGKIAFNKLLIPELVLEKKVIYLDTDLLVLDDLKSLYDTDIKDYLIAGVLDPDGVKTDIINKNDLNYINSGVMLMNLEQFRKTNYQEKIRDIIIYNSAQILGDQCIFNKLAENKKLIINKKFNFLVFPNLISEEERKIIKNLKEKEIKIIHFVGPIKPWMEWCNPLLSDIYSYYSNKLQNIDIKLKKINNILLALEYVSVLDKNSYYAKSNEIKYQIIKKLKTIQTINFDNDIELKNLFYLENMTKNTLESGKIKTSIIKILIQNKLKEDKNLNFTEVMKSISFNI